MVSRAHLCSHHQSSSIYVWVCNTRSHRQPEKTESHQKLPVLSYNAKKSICLHQWLNYLSRLCKWWVKNSLWKTNSPKSKWERILKRAFEWYATCQPWSVQQKTDQAHGGWISSHLIRFDQTNLIVDFSDTLPTPSFIIFVWLIILTQFTFVFIYCI